MKMYNLSYLLLLLTLLVQLNLVNNINNKRIPQHKPIEINDTQLSEINRLTDIEHFSKTLNEILIPRVVGTEGHKKVRNFIIKSMEDLNWQIDLDIFDAETPNLGTLKFQNIIATQNPNANRYLILACHYDSKYFSNIEFLGATDSAVPCAMLINLATTLNNNLIENNILNNDISLMFVFFDGEEAFLKWDSTDSIYGAKNLANKWNLNGFINKIDMLLLLDLIGTPDPKFYSFYKETELWYTRLLNAEQKLTNLGYLNKHITSGIIKSNNYDEYFQSKSANSYIEDDHIPFLKLGVPILHLIPIPFPDVWHTIDDNINIIDLTTVENLNKILRVFIAEYLKIHI